MRRHEKEMLNWKCHSSYFKFLSNLILLYMIKRNFIVFDHIGLANDILAGRQSAWIRHCF